MGAGRAEGLEGGKEKEQEDDGKKEKEAVKEGLVKLVKEMMGRRGKGN